MIFAVIMPCSRIGPVGKTIAGDAGAIGARANAASHLLMRASMSSFVTFDPGQASERVKRLFFFCSYVAAAPSFGLRGDIAAAKALSANNGIEAA